MDWKGLSIALIGYVITVGITYMFSWDIPWLILFSGLYLLGIILGWGWEEWTKTGIVYALVSEFVAFFISLFFAFSTMFSALFGNNWCPIRPCVPAYAWLLVIMIGTLVYWGISYFKSG